jgi:hypothetical protein
MRAALLILTALLFIGCSQRARCIRAYERCGPMWRTDTLEFFDSVVIERAIHDTLLSWQTMRVHDTVTIDRDRMRVRIVRLPGDSIWVQGECRDTVIRYVAQRVTVAGPEKESPWYILCGIAAVWFWLGWILRRRRR